MARTQADNYDQVRSRIIEAAAKVFANRGAHVATIIDIGEAIGSSKSRMYHYFPSKEAILFEMLKRHIDALVARAEEVVASDLPPSERLTRYIEVHLEQYISNRNAQTVLMKDVDALPPKELQAVRVLERKLVRLLSDLIRSIAPPAKTDGDATVTALLIYGMLNWTYTWYRPGGKVRPSDLARRITSLCLQGLSGK